MKRLTKMKAKEKSSELNENSVKRLYNKINTSALKIPPANLKKVVQTYTPYSITKYLNLCVQPSSGYVVSSSSIHQLQTISWQYNFLASECIAQHLSDSLAALFTFKYNENISNTSPSLNTAPGYHVLILKTGNQKYVSSCSCMYPGINVFPCTHITRLAAVFSEECIRNGSLRNILGSRIPVDLMFYSYWKCDNSGVSSLMVELMRKQTKICVPLATKLNTNEEEDESNELTGIEILNKKQRELSQFALWSDGKALYDQLHKLAWSYGVDSFIDLNGRLRELLGLLCKGKAPSVLDVNTRSIPSQVTCDGDGCTDEKTLNIVNPNAGNHVVGKRKRAWFEGIGKNKAGNGGLKGSKTCKSGNESNVLDTMVNMVDRNFHG